MTTESNKSKVGLRRAFEDSEEEAYKPSEVEYAAEKSGINTAAYRDKQKILTELNDQEIQRQIEERYKHDPTYAATMHGNKPSRGAKVDAEIVKEEAEMLAKKSHKMHHMPGK